MVSSLALSGVLLGFTFTSPSWAMDKEIDEVREIPTRTQTYASFLKYDLSKLEEAEKVIAQAGFLQEFARSIFAQYVKIYDRTQFLPYCNPENQKAFLSTVLAADTFNLPEELQEHVPPAVVQTLKIEYKNSKEKELPSLYEPYFRNIKHNIHEKGSLNYALFDTFFYHLLGVEPPRLGEGCWRTNVMSYSQENICSLLLQLEAIGFLKNFNMDSLTNVEEAYGPLEQLKFFQNKTKKEDVTNLVIAGGHIGRKFMESISRYKNILSIDLSAFEIPDVIADINDPRLLSTLVKYYSSHFNAIYDTSNMDGLRAGGFIQPKTAKTLVKMLRPGGRLMRQASWQEQPEIIDECTAQHFIKEYDLVPIYSDSPEHHGKIIALQKK